MHAGDGLEKCLGIVAVTLVVGVDANPVHGAAQHSLFLADHGNIVLRLAGQDAVVAAHALVQINRHTPRILFLLVVVRGIECEPRGRLFFPREVRLFPILLKTRLTDQRTVPAVRGVHGLVALRGGELVSFSGLVDLQACGDPRRGGRAQRIRAKSLSSSHAAGARAAVAESDGDRIVRMACLNPNRAGDLLAVQLKLDHVFGLDPEPLRHLGTDEHGIVPGELGHRLGELLKPAVVGELAIVDGGIAAEVELDKVQAQIVIRRFRELASLHGDRLCRKCRALDPAVVQRLPPELLEGSASEASTSRCGLSLPVAANEIVTRGIGLSGEQCDKL